MNRLLIVIALLALPTVARAQDDGAPANPVTASLQGLYAMTTGNVIKTAEMLDEAMYAYRPTEDVRAVGEMLAHIAGAQYMFCSIASGSENPASEDMENPPSSKEDIVAALKASTDFCNSVYAGMTDADGAAMRTVFGNTMAASAVMAFNTTHNYEHYGNLVTYMRINGIVPPSSQR